MMTQEAFEQIVAPHYDMLFMSAIKMCNGNVSNAEDMMQETWIKAYQNYEQFDGDDIKGWLYSILRNTTALYMKPRKHGWSSGGRRWGKETSAKEGQTYRELSIGDKFEIKSNERTPSDIIESQEVLARINSLLDSLPAQDRKVLQYSMDGVLDSEIAKRLNKTPGSIRGHLNRIRARLREQLRENN